MCVYLSSLSSLSSVTSSSDVRKPKKSTQISFFLLPYNLIIEASINSSYFVGLKDPHARENAYTKHLKCYCLLCNKVVFLSVRACSVCMPSTTTCGLNTQLLSNNIAPGPHSQMLMDDSMLITEGKHSNGQTYLKAMIWVCSNELCPNSLA